MKKTIKFLMLIMSLLLVGCGKSQDEASNTMQEPSYETQSDNNNVENESTDDSELNDEDIADDEPTDEDAEYDEDDYAEDEGIEAKGIIAMIGMRTSGAREIHETIISINPDNGQTQCVAEFLFCGQVLPDWKEYFHGYANYRNNFSSDYTKRAAMKVAYNNSLHAGWIDTNGDFFDVSEEAGDVPDSDFAAPPKHQTCGFSWDGKFVYGTKSYAHNGRYTYHVVDPDDIFEGSYVEKKIKKLGQACYSSFGFQRC